MDPKWPSKKKSKLKVTMVSYKKWVANFAFVCKLICKINGRVLRNHPESHIQEEGEPSEDFKKEVQEYFTEHSRPQMAFRQEQAEVEGGHGKQNFNIIATIIIENTRRLCIQFRYKHIPVLAHWRGPNDLSIKN